MNLDKLLSLPKSLYVSFRLFSFKDALKLPVVVRYNTRLLSLNGKIKVMGGVKRAMLSVGFNNVGLYDKKYQRSMLQIDGTIVLHGECKVSFGHGSRISIGRNGCVEFKGHFSNTAQMNLCCVDRVTFGDGVVTSWDTLVMDTDWHDVRHTDTGDVGKRTRPIVVGNGVWICTRSVVLKGCHIANGCIIGANSLVAGCFDEENCLIAGNPAQVRRSNVTLDRD